MAENKRSFAADFGRQALWSAKTPVIAAGGVFGFLFGAKSLNQIPWIAQDLAEGRAADAAYWAEVRRAYAFTYPEDKEVTQSELTEFAETANGIDTTFRASNFEYQNHIYEKLMELYGSPQGELEKLRLADDSLNLGELIEFLLVVGATGSAVVAAWGVVTFLPFALGRAAWARKWERWYGHQNSP